MTSAAKHTKPRKAALPFHVYRCLQEHHSSAPSPHLGATTCEATAQCNQTAQIYNHYHPHHPLPTKHRVEMALQRPILYLSPAPKHQWFFLPKLQESAPLPNLQTQLPTFCFVAMQPLAGGYSNVYTARNCTCWALQIKLLWKAQEETRSFNWSVGNRLPCLHRKA